MDQSDIISGNFLHILVDQVILERGPIAYREASSQIRRNITRILSDRLYRHD